jgi:Ca2+-binding EF-hand superfamily protein
LIKPGHVVLLVDILCLTKISLPSPAIQAILKLYDTLNGALPVRLRIPSDAEMRKLMQQHDKDASGKISLQEFTEMCR